MPEQTGMSDRALTHPARSRAETLALAVGLSVAPAVALGCGRFAYALLLPGMRSSLSWTYLQAGLMNTANAGGYLAGALVAAPIAGRLGVRRAYGAGVRATAVALLLTATTADFTALLVLRLLAGGAGAVCFVAGSVLASRLAAEGSVRATVILALYMAGGGLGVVLSGLVFQVDSSSWRAGWLALGLVSLAVAPAGVLAARRVRDPRSSTGGAAERPLQGLWVVLAAFVLFGLGYIGFVTFGVAFLRARGTGDAAVTGFWILLGAASVAGNLLWAPVLDRLSSGLGLSLVLWVLTVGALVPLVAAGPIGLPLGLVVSALLFGGCFLAFPAAVTGVVRRTAPAARWTAAIGSVTIGFAAGQCAGPLLAGFVSDRPGGLVLGLALSAGSLAVGAVLSLAHHDRRPAASEAPG
jgi:predicted MFS family arabinose efflux permease